MFSVGRAFRQAVVFGFATRRAQGRAAFQQFVGQHQLGVGQPGEGDQGGLVLAVQIDGDVLALGPGHDALEALVSPKTCAILLEPVQGEGGIVPADPEYLKKVRDLCDRENIILIFDEVQCGAGRTGKFLAAHNYGVKGDIVCMAKGIGAGFPIGACLATEEIAKDFTPGTHGSTFGGNALACAVSAYVLSRTATPEFLKSVEDKGNRLMDGLRDLQKEFPELVEDVRGLGLICGLQITVPTGEFVNRAMDNGLLLVAAQKNTIRFVPALTVENEEIDEAVAILRKVLQSFAV